jgi:hypothetical protein
MGTVKPGADQTAYINIHARVDTQNPIRSIIWDRLGGWVMIRISDSVRDLIWRQVL